MSQIKTLTEAQRARFPEIVDQWTRIGLCTNPADRPRAEAAINEIYACAGLKPPQTIVWCGSPLSQGLTQGFVEKMCAGVRDSVQESVHDSVWTSVVDRVRASVVNSMRESIKYNVKDSVVQANVYNDVWANVYNNVWDSVQASVRDNIMNSVRASIEDSVRNSVGASVGASVRDSIQNSVQASVWTSVQASVNDSVWDSVHNNMRGSIRASVGPVRSSIKDSMRDNVRSSIKDSVLDSVRDSIWKSIYGSHDAGWLAFYRYFHDVLGLTEETKKLNGLWELAQSAGWALPYENICWVSERHNILSRDDRGRLHSLTGPACAYPDGWKIYAVHGVRVPANIIENSSAITIKDINSTTNIEIRRVMIDLYKRDQKISGAAAYIRDAGGQRLDCDERFGTLWQCNLVDDEPIVMVEVINSTREPDGSFRHYFLRVDPQIRPLLGNNQFGAPQKPTAANAVASTFGMTGDQYAPVIES